MTHEDRWVSLSAYAKAYSVDRKTVYKWLDAGLLDFWRAGSVIRLKQQPPFEHPQPPRQEPPPDAVLDPPTPAKKAPRRRYYRPGPHAFRVNDAPVPDRPGVYVVRSGNAVKIGCSGNLRRRLYTLQALHFEPLPVVGYIETPSLDAAYRLEHALHQQFREVRLRGEWFQLTVDVIEDLQRRPAGVWSRAALVASVTRHRTD